MTAAEIAFWVLAAVLVYTFVGYPVLIYVLAKRFGKSVDTGDVQLPVELIIVAHNEEQAIVRKIENCLSQDYPGPLNVHIVSDGSTDKTCEIVRMYPDSRVSLTEFRERRGKAAALGDSIRASNADILVFCDVRQRLATNSVRNLVKGFHDPEVGAVSGELVFEDIAGKAKGLSFYWRYEKKIRMAEARFESATCATGALYAVRRSLAGDLPSGTILDDVLVPMQVVLNKGRVWFEESARVFDRTSSSISEEKKRKVRTAAGVFQLPGLCPGLFSPLRNRIWWQFMSHRVLRVICPFVLIGALALLLHLAGTSVLYSALAIAAGVFLAIALLGAMVPALRAFFPIRIIHTFMALNWFALLGFFQFALDRTPHLWASGPKGEGVT